MRVDEDSEQVFSNGHTASSNGSTPRKPLHTALNGHVNGSSPSYANGTSKKHTPVRSATYRGHNREEVVRILIQGLMDMGYSDAASVLSSESGYELESPSVAAFRSAILEGVWSEAEAILQGSHQGELGGPHYDDDQYGDGLVLAEGADRGQMLFWIRQQKFLELLDRRDLGMALMVLRQELTPLGHDIHQLHALSTLLMCPPEDLRSKAHWSDTVEESRKLLLQDLSRSIAPSVMIRDHRLAELFDHIKQSQINQCLYHNTAEPPSLYSDHICDRDDFPSRTAIILEDHTGEVWHIQFSHDGTKLATASQDRSVNIYETVTFKRLHSLTHHSAEVTYVSWSPDDTKIITCSQDCKARVYDVESGRLEVTLEHQAVDQNYGITAAAWTPDSQGFVTASHDRNSQLCHWNLRAAKREQPVHVWPRGFRVQDVAITVDGHWLVALDPQNIIRIFDMHTYREEPPIKVLGKMTSISLSQDGNTVLVNLAVGEVHMIDLITRDTVRKFRGQKQGEFVIRSCFGGAAENFVVSGSEDGLIYVWHKENESLIEKLAGHGRGQSGKECVTTVDWNPRDAGMFASGGDDRKVRIWTNTRSPIEGLPSNLSRSLSRHDSGRTSALRSTL
ncbi:WD repeat-containing protein 26 [Cladophialophora carrionii]|uniref:Protein FYV10 n=1 Tax=Cladophialophora carrionii TaxID=86049 RepID=A0A1C1CV53_9EURO|nr:WD repeat-containing protein 26 [Cladophialophora carrionii]